MLKLWCEDVSRRASYRQCCSVAITVLVTREQNFILFRQAYSALILGVVALFGNWKWSSKEDRVWASGISWNPLFIWDSGMPFASGAYWTISNTAHDLIKVSNQVVMMPAAVSPTGSS